jgi:beta-lactam-binding protein with PASTA domain
MKPEPRATALVALAIAAVGCGGSHPHRAASITTPRTAPPTTSTTAPPPVNVPSVSGETAAKAQAALKRAGLTTQVVRIFSSTPAGQVIRTAPPGFASATSGQLVTVYVSEGPPKIAVPDLIGETQATAIRTASRLGFTVVVTQQAGSGTPGEVSTQAPLAHTKVLRGTTLQLTVQTAIPRVTMPDVVGESEETAVTTLSGLGLAIAFKTQAVAHLKRDRLVLAQSQPVGAKLTKGSQVTLTVGLYKRTTGGATA